MRLPALRALALAAALLAAAGALGEEPTPIAEANPFGEAIDVRVVNVDVYVTDEDGKPVFGLRPEDFDLREDGRPIAITNFYAVEDGVPAVAPDGDATAPLAEPARRDLALEPVPVPEDQQLSLVLYFDNLFLKPFTRNRVVDGVRTFLQRRVGTGDRVMLVTFDKSLHVRQTFTEDRRVVAERLGEIETLSAFAESKETERKELMRRLDDTKEVFTAQSLVESYAESEYFDLKSSMDALQSVVSSLGGLPGRKAILYVSDGIPMRAGEDLFYFLDLKFGVSKQSGLLSAARYGAGRYLSALTALANANRVSFYTLDATGLRSHRSLSAEHGGGAAGTSRLELDSLRLSNEQEPLQILAADTGGIAAFNTNNVRGALDRMSTDFRNYYSLGYQPVHPGDGRYHEVDVVVKRKGVKVRHREGYRDKSAEAKTAEATLASLLHGIEANPLEVEVVFEAARPRDEGFFLVPIRVRIPIGKVTLVPYEGVHRASLRVSIAVADEDRSLSSVEQTPVPIVVPDDQLELARGKLFAYEAELVMRPGRQTVAVAVRDELSGIATYVRREVSVPR